MKEPMIKKEYLEELLKKHSVRDISKMLDIPVSTIYNYMKKYKLPSAKGCCVTKEELESLFKEHTIAEVATILNRSPNTVYLWKQRYGIHTKKGGRAVPEDFKEYARTHTRAETAQHYGINYEAVRVMEAKTDTRCSLRSVTTLERLEDLPILLKYMTQSEVASILGVTLPTIKNWLSKIKKGSDIDV